MKEDRENKHYLPEMPAVSCPYLLDYFFEVGPAIPTGMGLAPLTHEHLRPWQDDLGIRLRPWETRFMVSLSKEWISALQEGEDPFCDPPWADAPHVRPKAERLMFKLKAQL